MKEKIGSTEPHSYEISAFAAELGGAPTVDLHGLSTDEAESALDQFINHSFANGEEAVKIIHGRGAGKLREMVMNYLKDQTELVAFFRGSNAPGERGGVTLAVLHSRRPSK